MEHMKRVTGIGGVFFKSENPEKVREWYQKHLGIESEAWGATFDWKSTENPAGVGTTAWNPFKADTTHFAPSEKPFMINYRVGNLTELLKILKEEGVEIIDSQEDADYGKFGWIMDLEGNKIELWEPPQGM